MFVRRGILAAVSAIAICLGGCTSAPVRPLTEKERRAQTERIWLVSNRFHTSIAVEANDAPPSVRKLDPKARYFIIGWGGRDLYMKSQVWPWQWVTTIILPTASALHVIPTRDPLPKACPNSEIIEFTTSRRGQERVRNHLARAFAHDKKGKVLVAGPGKFPASRFYSGSETYFLPKTCNLWAAKVLKLANVPIYVWPAWSADNLLWQGHKHGKVIRCFRLPADEL